LIFLELRIKKLLQNSFEPLEFEKNE